MAAWSCSFPKSVILFHELVLPRTDLVNAFTVKMHDDLSAALENHLKAIGKTRSAFVRELIERELASEQRRRDELRERVMALAGIAGRDDPPVRPRTDTAGDKKRALLDSACGLDNAHLRRR